MLEFVLFEKQLIPSFILSFSANKARGAETSGRNIETSRHENKYNSNKIAFSWLEFHYVKRFFILSEYFIMLIKWMSQPKLQDLNAILLTLFMQSVCINV